VPEADPVWTSHLGRSPASSSPQTLAHFGPGSGWDPDRDCPWELYDLTSDFSQARDVAAQHPDTVEELRALWWEEAERNRVLPLLGGLSVMYGILPPLPTVARFSFAGDVQNVQRGMVPRIYGRSYAIEAELAVPEGGAEGVIVANADFIGGFALWVDGGGLLHHTYSLLGVETYRQVATEPLPTGDVTVRMLFDSDTPTPGSGGTVTLFVGDRTVGQGTMPRTVPIAFSSYSGMDVGRDNGLVVDLEYEPQAPYAFAGTVKRVVFDLQPAHHDAELELHRHAAVHALGAGAAG
jgi:arylsulfatase